MVDRVVSAEDVERTITAFTKLDKRGDRKAMNKLAMRLQKEQPHLLQFAAQVRNDHGDATGEAAVFYATLVWSMFDRDPAGTLPRLSNKNIIDAESVVGGELAKIADLGEKEPYDRVSPALAANQPHIYAKLRELLEEDVREKAMTRETCEIIIKPTQVVIEAFDADAAGRRRGEKQGTIVVGEKVGRNDVCPCGSGKKYKKCHGA